MGVNLTRCSTTGFCTYLGGNCLSWGAKKQQTVARSTVEAEYRALASTAAEITWISFILRDIGLYLHQPPILFSDNIFALHMTINPVFHARTKHIEIDYHFVREKVALGSLITRFVSSPNPMADIFTKPLPRHSLESLKAKLGLWSLPTPSLKGGIEDSNSIIQNSSNGDGRLSKNVAEIKQDRDLVEIKQNRAKQREILSFRSSVDLKGVRAILA